MSVPNLSFVVCYANLFPLERLTILKVWITKMYFWWKDGWLIVFKQNRQRPNTSFKTTTTTLQQTPQKLVNTGTLPFWSARTSTCIFHLLPFGSWHLIITFSFYTQKKIKWAEVLNKPGHRVDSWRKTNCRL